MKTAKETLREFIMVDHQDDEPHVLKAMKAYALEACKETLKNVSGSLPDVLIRKNHFEFIELKKHLMSEDNIPKELL